MTKEEITYEEFLAIQAKLEIKIGEIMAADRVPKSYGLKLYVDFGGDDTRTVFSNIGKTNEPEDLVGLKMPFITNLAPSVIKGVNSQAMIMTEIGLNKFEKGTILL